jgi:ribosomal protein S21
VIALESVSYDVEPVAGLGVPTQASRRPMRARLDSVAMQSQASTVEQYLAELPADRRADLEAVRKVIRANLDSGFEEGMQYGMIGYSVPHRLFPAGYHCDPKQPLSLAALGSQKNYMALHMMCIYDAGTGMNPHAEWFQREWKKTGKKLDMGKACIRFKKLDDLALDVIGAAFKRITAKSYIETYQRARESYKPTPRAEIKKAVAARELAKKKAKKRATS